VVILAGQSRAISGPPVTESPSHKPRLVGLGDWDCQADEHVTVKSFAVELPIRPTRVAGRQTGASHRVGGPMVGLVVAVDPGAWGRRADERVPGCGRWATQFEGQRPPDACSS
jgi:hypothetical protein